MIKNFSRVISSFTKNYAPIPLEIFKKNAYKTLVSTLLSSRTRDEVTLEAANRLFKDAPTLAKLDLLKMRSIEKLIYPVGFYKTKSRHLKKLTKILITKYNSQIPQTREELMSLPGVGRKTANLVLNRAFSIPAIAVDTHVHRITNLLGWVKTKSPQDTEKSLIQVVPTKYWRNLNKLFVSIGRKYNTPKKLNSFLIKEGLLKVKDV